MVAAGAAPAPNPYSHRFPDGWVSTGQVVMGLRSEGDLADINTALTVATARPRLPRGHRAAPLVEGRLRPRDQHLRIPISMRYAEGEGPAVPLFLYHELRVLLAIVFPAGPALDRLSFCDPVNLL